jgi:hypothetical protein
MHGTAVKKRKNDSYISRILATNPFPFQKKLFERLIIENYFGSERG